MSHNGREYVNDYATFEQADSFSVLPNVTYVYVYPSASDVDEFSGETGEDEVVLYQVAENRGEGEFTVAGRDEIERFRSGDVLKR